jgi:hypothetical protein
MTSEERLQYDGDGAQAMLNLVKLVDSGLVRLTNGSIDAAKASRQLAECQARGYVPDEHKIEGWEKILMHHLGAIAIVPENGKPTIREY